MRQRKIPRYRTRRHPSPVTGWQHGQRVTAHTELLTQRGKLRAVASNWLSAVKNRSARPPHLEFAPDQIEIFLIGCNHIRTLAICNRGPAAMAMARPTASPVKPDGFGKQILLSLGESFLLLHGPSGQTGRDRAYKRGTVERISAGDGPAARRRGKPRPLRVAPAWRSIWGNPAAFATTTPAALRQGRLGGRQRIVVLHDQRSVCFQGRLMEQRSHTAPESAAPDSPEDPVRDPFGLRNSSAS